jgi:hypothetical protein
MPPSEGTWILRPGPGPLSRRGDSARGSCRRARSRTRWASSHPEPAWRSCLHRCACSVAPGSSTGRSASDRRPGWRRSGAATVPVLRVPGGGATRGGAWNPGGARAVSRCSEQCDSEGRPFFAFLTEGGVKAPPAVGGGNMAASTTPPDGAALLPGLVVCDSAGASKRSSYRPCRWWRSDGCGWVCATGSCRCQWLCREGATRPSCGWSW